jgi:1-acyl-sn-glycerol-3-phosphate acyltransferase
VIFIRSLVFNTASFGWTFALLFLYMPLLLLPRASMLSAIRFWIGGVFRLQRSVLRLDFTFRGTENLPDGPCIIASAHQSAWDTIAFYAVIDDPVFVLKKELYRVPMFGPYARRLNMIAIDRSGGTGEARRMIRDVAGRLADGRKVVIFPGGTRSAPGEIVPLKSGCFWGRRSFRKKSGCIVAQFQEPIPPGLDAADFDRLLSERIHRGNRALLDEAGTD